MTTSAYVQLFIVLYVAVMLTLARIVYLIYKHTEAITDALPDQDEMVPASLARLLLYGHKQVIFEEHGNFEYIRDGLERERKQMYEETLPPPATYEYQKERWPWRKT